MAREINQLLENPQEISLQENSVSVKKIACVLTHGCPESRIDSARVQVFLQKNNYDITSNVEEADLILFRTCGLTEGAEVASLETIENIKSKMKKNADFIPWGCLHKINPTALSEYNDITFCERTIGVLNKTIKAKIPIEDVSANFLLPKHEHVKTYNRIIGCRLLLLPVLLGIKQHPLNKDDKYDTPSYIKASTGCLDKCTYCSVRLSRGILCSKNIESVLSEFRQGLKNGYKDFRLLGTDLGAYGRDNEYTLVDLINRMTEEEGDYVISLNNVNPKWLIKMYDELQPSFSSKKIRYLSVPFESGSNRILNLMGRAYTIEDYKRCVKDLNRRYPHILLNTQVMVGFPTETYQDFRQSEQLIKDMLFDMIEPYKYSPRRGTPSALMNDQVPEHIKNYRLLRLMIVSMLYIFRRKTQRLYRGEKW